MICYVCGNDVADEPICPYCGANVALYCKLIRLSNKYYNDGLTKAKVRNLTGAAESLLMSLDYDNSNVDARNLLGLVYYAMGELVPAMSEWAHSASFKPDNNLAVDYIDVLKHNLTQLKVFTGSIERYNHGLRFCLQNNLDTARIQLQKAVKDNPQFVKARLLLCLVYMCMEDWNRALLQVKSCLSIDSSNVTALRYLSEIQGQTGVDSGLRDIVPTRTRNEKYAPDARIIMSDQGEVVQPPPPREHSLLKSVLFLTLGIALGLAVSFVLIQPARINSAKESQTQEIKKLGDEIVVKNTAIADLEQKNVDLSDQIDKLRENLGIYVGDDSAAISTNAVMSASALYLADENDIESILYELDLVEEEFIETSAEEACVALYEALCSSIANEAYAIYYDSGSAAFEEGDYDKAIIELNKALKFAPDDADALFLLANAYYDSGNRSSAAGVYTQIVEKYPDTEAGRQSSDKLNGLLANE